MSKTTLPVAGTIGFFLGLFLAGGSYFTALTLGGTDTTTAAIVGGVAGLIGAGYSALAFSRAIYPVGFLSLLGLVLDLSWSLPNTLAAFLVWAPACKLVKANFVTPTANSRRSGTLVYDKNPRGGGYIAMTIGTVIAGGWSSHEETHVWQARIFGPTYLLSYLIAAVLNFPFRLLTGKTKNLQLEAYYRIPFEDWAYWAGSISSNRVRWRGWFLGFLLALVYTAALIAILTGFIVGVRPLWLTGILVLVLYSLIRAFAPRGH